MTATGPDMTEATARFGFTTWSVGEWELRPTPGEVPPGAALAFEPTELPFDHTAYVTLGTVSNGADGVFETVLDVLLEKA